MLMHVNQARRIALLGGKRCDGSDFNRFFTIGDSDSGEYGFFYIGGCFSDGNLPCAVWPGIRICFLCSLFRVGLYVKSHATACIFVPCSGRLYAVCGIDLEMAWENGSGEKERLAAPGDPFCAVPHPVCSADMVCAGAFYNG